MPVSVSLDSFNTAIPLTIHTLQQYHGCTVRVWQRASCFTIIDAYYQEVQACGSPTKSDDPRRDFDS